ncbi:MAG: DUF2892 domain-containing protein [Bacteroidota bacterium]
MKKNMGTTDRIIRTLAALLIAALLLTGYIQGVIATVLGVFAIVFLVTSALGFCPLYLVLKVSTCKAPTPKVR